MFRADDWLKQAKKDLKHAKESMKIEHFEWAVLAAQQSAEKAIKALYYELGGDPWGHSLLKFLKELPSKFEVEQELIKAAKNLDKHYITSRYPNGFASGAPEDYYIKQDAEEAIENGKKILEFCENQISTLREETEQNIEE
ncbi:MAG: HEPN domain-containing protein [Candidatus Lokiarchaeota archaeon]|nr:HEPN domain-containing protein [Candidatus Lokiarchaeota archaeon]